MKEFRRNRDTQLIIADRNGNNFKVNIGINSNARLVYVAVVRSAGTEGSFYARWNECNVKVVEYINIEPHNHSVYYTWYGDRMLRSAKTVWKYETHLQENNKDGNTIKETVTKYDLNGDVYNVKVIQRFPRTGELRRVEETDTQNLPNHRYVKHTVSKYDAKGTAFLETARITRKPK